MAQSSEKISISQMFDREAKREKNLETRAKELRLAAKKAEQQQVVLGASLGREWLMRRAGERQEGRRRREGGAKVEGGSLSSPEGVCG